jgi:hypothetical protein
MTNSTLHSFNVHLYSRIGLPIDGLADSRLGLELVANSLFPVSFEEAGGRLEQLERMYFEWDGSFVWVGDTPTRWQVDGMLYDHSGRLHRVELKGSCPQSAWRQLLNAFGVEPEWVVVHEPAGQRWWGGEAMNAFWENGSA